MKCNTNICIDFTTLDNTLASYDNIPRDGNTRLAMNDKTVYKLTGHHFYDDRLQTYYGFQIIQDEDLDIGEVIILVNYERMKFQWDAHAKTIENT